MADRVSVAIRIGGSLDRTLVPELLAAIDSDDARADWEGEAFCLDTVAPGSPLYLVANEVAWGAFGAIEAFCRDHGLAYARWSGGSSGSFGPERVVFDGTHSVQSHVMTDDDEVMISAETVERCGSIAAILAYFSAANLQIGPFMVVGSDVDDRMS